MSAAMDRGQLQDALSAPSRAEVEVVAPPTSPRISVVEAIGVLAIEVREVRRTLDKIEHWLAKADDREESGYDPER